MSRRILTLKIKENKSVLIDVIGCGYLTALRNRNNLQVMLFREGCIGC